MTLWVFALSVWREVIGGAGRRGPIPGAIISDIDPDTSFFHPFSKPSGTLCAIEHPDWRIIGMEAIRTHDLLPDQFDQGAERAHAAPTPVSKGGVRDISAHAREDLVQTIQWKMVVIFRDKDEGEKARSRHACGDWTARCGVDLDEASPGIIAFAPKGLASQLSAPLIYMLASDIVTPRNVRDTQTINANLFNDSQFPGVRPSATTLNTNQNFLSHNFHPCYR